MLRRLALAALALATSVAAQPVPLDSLAAAFAEAHALPSLVVGLVADGERHVAGVGDVAGEAPDAGTRYEIGSITKVLTAIALADAVVRGDTAFEAPLADVLGVPVGAHEAGPIRLVDLATHTSGLPRLDMTMGFAPGFDLADPYARYTPADLVAFLGRAEPSAAPGEAHLYSNAAVGALGYALAARADTTYAALLADRVLGPLGMTTATVGAPDDRTAVGHDAAGDTTARWAFTDASAGAGAVVASVTDLMALAEAAIDPAATPLADALALTLEPRVALEGGRGQALGWLLFPLNGGATMAAHEGGTGGFSSLIAVVPSEGLAVVVLANRSGEVGALGLDILGRIRTAQL